MPGRIDRIKALLIDVDGVMTDGGMYYSESGDEWKRFNTRDGHGISLLQKKGFKIGIITKEDTKIVKRRAKKLNVEDLYDGVADKTTALRHFAKKYKLSLKDIAYIGDDTNDIGIMNNVGLPIAVKDALPEVKKIARFVTDKKGGHGAVREVCDMLLKIG